jgi:hypothetical protein
MYLARNRPLIAPAAVIASLVASGAIGSGAADFDSAHAMRWVQRLGSPDLGGRRTGTPDGERAAEMVIEGFRAAGLEPAGDAGAYRQEFEFPFYQIVSPVRLAIDDGGATRELKYADDFFFVTGTGNSRGRAAVVFAGYGLAFGGFDEYEGLDVRGRVVVAIEGAPPWLAAPPGVRSNLAKARHTRALGAVGLLTCPDPTKPAPLTKERVWVLRPENYLDGFVFGRISPATAAAIVKAPLENLKKELDEGRRPTSRVAPTSVAWQATVVFDLHRKGSNILGKLTGADRQRRDELVIVGAHYDGGGIDPDGTVYPGAEDNASGTSVVLALAEALASRPRPGRTVIFAAWGAEEQGAWGSRAYVSTTPLDRIAATFTLDNVGVGDGRFRAYGAHNFPEEYAIIARAIEPSIAKLFTPRGAGGSDGWTFQIRGVPSFFAHAEATQPYVHTPADTPATIAPVSLASAGSFMAQAMMAVANAPAGFIRSNRLARYVSRHAFLVGWTRNVAQDWYALRKRGFDLVIVEARNADDARRVTEGLGTNGVLVKTRASLGDDEEGRPLRVIVATRVAVDRGELSPAPIAPARIILADRLPRALTPGIAWLRPTREGFEADGLKLVRSSGAPNALLRQLDIRTLAQDQNAGLVLDVETAAPAEEVSATLLSAGVDVESIEDLLGGRVMRWLAKVLADR